MMASHEEADDRIMYSINQVFQRKNSETITVVTSDTDIITVLIYHFNNAWVVKSVHVLKKGRIVSSKQQYELYPLHRILLQVGRGVINSLSAAHSLTGCNTVVKVGTKGSMLKALKKHSDLLGNFATDRLDEDNILSAEEKFLVKVIESKKLSGCPTFNDLSLKLYIASPCPALPRH